MYSTPQPTTSSWLQPHSFLKNYLTNIQKAEKFLGTEGWHSKKLDTLKGVTSPSPWDLVAVKIFEKSSFWEYKRS